MTGWRRALSPWSSRTSGARATVPQRIYLILEKMTRVISSVDSMRRFVMYPGTRILSENPRIVALQRDPDIAKDVGSRNFLSLLANPKIVAAVNDPHLEGLVKRFELEKALDYALAGNPPPAQNQ
jgi:hypothetical protein